MEKNDKKRIAKALKKIGEKLEKDEIFLSELEKFLCLNNGRVNRKAEKDVDINVFEIFNKQGEELLRNNLQKLAIKHLIKIIQKNNFDTSKLSYKWKDKDKIIDLIVERLKTMMEKGKSFLEY